MYSVCHDYTQAILPSPGACEGRRIGDEGAQIMNKYSQNDYPVAHHQSTHPMLKAAVDF